MKWVLVDTVFVQSAIRRRHMSRVLLAKNKDAPSAVQKCYGKVLIIIN